MMNTRIDEAVRALADVLDELGLSAVRLEREVAAAEEAVATAERHLKKALSGMTASRWRAFVSGRASIRTAENSRDAHLASKRRPAVEAALAEVNSAYALRESTAARADSDRSKAAQALKPFGPLAVRLCTPATAALGAGAPVTRRVPCGRDPKTPGGSPMKVRNAVKDYQRRLAELDAEYSRSQDRLDAALAKRARALEEQDQLVVAAQREVEAAITAMALAAGIELTASLLDVEVSRVRRLVKEGRDRPERGAIPDPGHAAVPASGG